ncbi:MAG: hypothetical protein Q4C70_12815 [Planctomycetia bacterium]|nr:hypothetical protein [Planctomycetia bacterium]
MKKERIEYVAIKFYFLDWEGKESYSETVHVNRRTGKIRWKWIIDGYEIHGTYSDPGKFGNYFATFHRQISYLTCRDTGAQKKRKRKVDGIIKLR